DATDSFSSLWRKALREITVREVRAGLGFDRGQQEFHRSIIENLPDQLSPDEIRRTLTAIGKTITLVVALDEFDRLTNPEVAALVADTVKSLSDTAAPVTVIIIGVAH